MDVIAAQAFVFFVAGFETSSATMTFCLYQLARNPDIQERVQNEIDTVLQKHDGNITYEAISEMGYLDKVVSGELISLYTYNFPCASHEGGHVAFIINLRPGWR